MPKRSTTSYCTTGSGGITPERTDDAVKRRELMARLTAPSPTEITASQWEQYENRWKRHIEESDRREREQMAARFAADEEAEKRQRQEKTFNLLLTNLFADATATERTRVTRLVQQKHSKGCRDLNVWEMTLRTLRETLQGEGVGLDWRGGLGK